MCAAVWAAVVRPTCWRMAWVACRPSLGWASLGCAGLWASLGRGVATVPPPPAADSMPLRTAWSSPSLRDAFWNMTSSYELRVISRYTWTRATRHAKGSAMGGEQYEERDGQ